MSTEPLDPYRVLAWFALRFDGYAIIEPEGIDPNEIIEEFARTGSWGRSMTITKWRSFSSANVFFADDRMVCPSTIVSIGRLTFRSSTKPAG